MKTHVLQFPSPKTASLRNDLLVEFKCWLESKYIHLDSTSFITSDLSYWFTTPSSYLEKRYLKLSLLIASETQSMVGLEAVLFGLVEFPLIVYQQQYYTDLHSRKLSTRWVVKLVSKL